MNIESLHSVPTFINVQQMFESKLANTSEDFNRKYLGHLLTEHLPSDYPNDEYGRDMLRQDAGRVNSSLDALGIHRLGDLLSPAMHEAEKTLAV